MKGHHGHEAVARKLSASSARESVGVSRTRFRDRQREIRPRIPHKSSCPAEPSSQDRAGSSHPEKCPLREGHRPSARIRRLTSSRHNSNFGIARRLNCAQSIRPLLAAPPVAAPSTRSLPTLSSARGRRLRVLSFRTSACPPFFRPRSIYMFTVLCRLLIRRQRGLLRGDSRRPRSHFQRAGARAPSSGQQSPDARHLSVLTLPSPPLGRARVRAHSRAARCRRRAVPPDFPRHVRARHVEILKCRSLAKSCPSMRSRRRRPSAMHRQPRGARRSRARLRGRSRRPRRGMTASRHDQSCAVEIERGWQSPRQGKRERTYSAPLGDCGGMAMVGGRRAWRPVGAAPAGQRKTAAKPAETRAHRHLRRSPVRARSLSGARNSKSARDCRALARAWWGEERKAERRRAGGRQTAPGARAHRFVAKTTGRTRMPNSTSEPQKENGAPLSRGV